MTDTQFWRELDKVARKGMTEETAKEFADLLMYGYKNGKNLCEIGLVNQSDRSLVNQLYEGNFDKRLMLCSTTFSKGKCSVLNKEKNNEMGLPSGTLWKSSNEVNGNHSSGLFTFDEAVEFATQILNVMNEVKDNFECDFTFNIEMIPAENTAGTPYDFAKSHPMQDGTGSAR